MFPLPSSFIPENISVFPISLILTFCWSIIVTTLIITVGLYLGTQLSGYHSDNLKSPVNRTSCTCNCWDGFYRGIHARGGYKIFYINYEFQTIILIGIFLFYAELLRNFLVQLIANKQFITLLLIPAIYSNFYGTWNLINYLNDHDYHRMLPSQLFFSITELLANYIFYRYLLMNKTDLSISPWCIYLVSIICSIHILLAVKELNIELMRRNIFLLIPDFITLTWVIIVISKNNELLPNKRTAGIWLGVGGLILLFYYTICPFRE